LLFTKNGTFVYGIFAACIICSFLMLFIMYGGIRGFVRVLRVPKHILLPIVMVLCCVGAFGLNSRVFDIWCILFFGLLALILESFGFPMPPIILGFILENMIESNLRRGLQQSKNSFLPFLTRPISAVFLLITVIVLAVTFYKQARESHAEKKTAADSQ